MVKSQQVSPSSIQVLNLSSRIDQIHIQKPNRLLQLPDPRASFNDLDIQVLQLPLRLEERVGPQGNLLHQVQLHHVQILRKLLLQDQVFGRRRERTRRPERRAVLQREILLEVKRRNLAQARDERFAAVALRVQSGGLQILGGVVPNVLEPVVGIGD